MELPKSYDAKGAEQRWRKHWEEHQTYRFRPGGEIFSIDTPPPTVSGKMHLGHSFSYTQQDIIARFQRMQGKSVFYPFGTDDNGLATDKLVEKTKGIKSKHLPRDEYRKLALDTVKELRPEFVNDWKALGMSCDFEETYSTIDEKVQRISQKAFLDLYRKGYVYRKETPVSWCPLCQTAIAQAEFDNVEMSSSFNDIIFKAKGHDLVIATTRPELLPACVGLFYHPDDGRYQHLKGAFAKVPLFDYDVPILPDETVAMDKGTGLMMCCTFGDKEDIEKWHKYKLPLKAIFTKDGKLNEHAKTYEGLSIKDGRKAIIKELEERKLLIVSKPITHPVNVHERCGTEIEFLNTWQWFINILDHKEQLIAAADSIKWHPEHMKVRYIHWVENLNWDWCISRQRYYGIPFPIWYDQDGAIVLPDEKELPVDPTTTKPKGHDHHHKQLTPETDVMDTWATSSITPFITMGWDADHQGFKGRFPMTLRPQAHDIIRTWAFYTITRGIYQEQTVPWENIMVSGFVLDPKGNKMSKSKGNVIAPQDVMDKYGADALRYWAAGSKLGDDLPYMEKDVQTGQKTVTKLWNASKFTLQQLEGYDGTRPEHLETTDRWLLSELQRTIGEATAAYESYEYAKAKAAVDLFFWNTFCDYYLELVKDRIYNPQTRGEEAKRSAQFTLSTTLLTLLKLFAPLMPFITEEIHDYAFAKNAGESIHLARWPEVDPMLADEDARRAGALLIDALGQVRRAKSEAKVSLKVAVEDLAISCTMEEGQLLRYVEDDLKAAASATKVTYTTHDGEADQPLRVTVTLAPAPVPTA